MEELEVEPVSPKSQVQDVGVFMLVSLNVAVRPVTEEVKLETGILTTVIVVVLAELLPIALVATKVTV